MIDAVRSVAIEEILPRYRSVVSDPTEGSRPLRKEDGSVVTEADFAAQRALVRRLTALDAVPILAEEMRGDEQLRIWEEAVAGEAAQRFWCVDPLDGTRNFSLGVPSFAVSVALMEGHRPLFGTVYDPISDDAYYALHKGGAWLNHRPLNVPSRGPGLSESVAQVSLRKEAASLRSAIKHHRPYARRVTSGSSTLSWCHLAAGRTDVCVDSGQMAWDYAAGSLIFAEAGGRLATFDQDDFWASASLRRSVIAARTPELFAEWKTWVRSNLECG